MEMIKLEWKEGVKVDLQALDAKMKEDFPEAYKGNQAHSHLELFFEQISEEEKEQVMALWEALDEEHELVASYKSKEQIAQDLLAKKASAKAKLLALGLTEEEILAITGA